MEENNIEQTENKEPVDEIVYADPPEEFYEKIEQEDEESVEELAEENVESLETPNQENSIEQIDEGSNVENIASTITIINNKERIIPHSSFHEIEALELEDGEVSKRRRLALKLSAMNSNNK